MRAGSALHSTAQHSTAQQQQQRSSTAAAAQQHSSSSAAAQQHSTAQLAERWPRTRHLGLPQALRCTAQHSTAQHSSSSSAAAQQQQRSSTAAAAQQHSSTAQHSLKPAPPGLPCCLPRGRTSPVTPQVDMQWSGRAVCVRERCAAHARRLPQHHPALPLSEAGWVGHCTGSPGTA